ncbi:MAG: hypothetical protein MUD01_20965 [Chloroflexaceae bacterium]|jgi:predicted GNAT superfamily acetyltransferase|nr:hypothetical protein [Chloroflexaceae bacterium]
MHIRPLQTLAEYGAAEELQRLAWGRSPRDLVPAHVLLTAQKNGGLVLGAFDEAHDPPTLAGYAFGFLGLTADGTLKHCSHQVGVLPAYRDQGLGYRLKLAQREFVLAQGVDLMTWTFDPLESRNANLNIRKLGATCRSYLPDLYGSRSDALNAGLPSDRFEVEWHLARPTVAARLAGQRPTPPQTHELPLLNPAPPDDPDAPATTCAPLPGGPVLLRLPANIQLLKAQRPELALPWRMQLRDLCQAAFAAGFAVVDVLHQQGLSYYVLAPFDLRHSET